VRAVTIFTTSDDPQKAAGLSVSTTACRGMPALPQIHRKNRVGGSHPDDKLVA